MGRFQTTVTALVIAAGVAPLSAQSLAEVARQEEARRKALPTHGKVYTNESLRPEPPPSTAATPAQPAAPAAPAPEATPPAAGAPPQTPGQPAAGQPPGQATPSQPAALQTEAEWRKRVADARDALTRSQTFAEALQSRINALSTDFVNRDDPIQREQIAADRQKALAELDRVRREIQDQQKAIAAIQEEARKAGVPAGWVR
ncbi:MAG: hypothetical protein HYU37_12295 [Acidobacteria bacterium]|nr:hypothetical protein [Acidobacteriota bacterium]